MKKMQLSLLIATLMVTLTTACSSDPRTASKSNFEAAINQEMKLMKQLCFPISTHPLPFALRNDGLYSYSATRGQMEALRTAGLVTGKPIKVEGTYVGLNDEVNPNSNKSTLVDAVEYSLSETGKADYVAELPPTVAWPNGGAGFCFADAEVEDITDYTEPKEVNGDTVTTVKYTYSATNIKSWAKQEAVEKAFPDFSQAVKGEVPAQMTLVQGVKGWNKAN